MLQIGDKVKSLYEANKGDVGLIHKIVTDFFEDNDNQQSTDKDRNGYCVKWEKSNDHESSWGIRELVLLKSKVIKPKPKSEALYFVPLGFDDEGKIQKSVEKMQGGKAVTGYLITEETLKERLEEGLFENGVVIYKFVSKGKAFKKIEIKLTK